MLTSTHKDMEPFTPRFEERTLQAQIQELMCYIWDNYLQLYDRLEDIFLMGVGNAYLGVKVLLINRRMSPTLPHNSRPPHDETSTNLPRTTVDVKSRISGVVNFVNGNLRPVKSDVDQELSSWYKDNSQVYVANDHACWSDPDLTRKVMKRRFGNVIRSQANGLTPMMAEHFTDVQQFILDRVAAAEEGRGDTTEDEGRMG